jgi:ABC-type glycerol-3-phosphate transport system substrate-binding protein
MDTSRGAGTVQQSLNRRGFLRVTVGGLAGVAGILAIRQPPAIAQQRELTLLSFNHFVPQSDDELRKQAAEFGRKGKVKVTVDTIAGPQIPSKLAAEVETRSGHDVVALPRSSP